ncbi:ester cyclase [Streptomyces rubrogriseus]|uniref:Ester cyclase n=1 Tax=Streptomyces rubrogriseus TaxID=194673 RepID=A0A6G3TDJ6_9ACTN|nr:ester cyclase [Streptomyces rubrogriseus]MYS71295.1 ester cyclase [Streptomyces sp. SID5926]NEC34787.1 ester cyclase [Streptomyces rubrogriseus]
MSNKIKIRRILDEGFSQGNVDVLDELMTEDFVNHNAAPGMAPGRDGVKAVIKAERQGFPDLKVEVIRDFEDGEYVIQHVRLTGTHQGTVFGAEPTGRTISWNEIHIARVRDGRVSDHWACNDLHVLLMQLGKMTPPDTSAFRQAVVGS